MKSRLRLSASACCISSLFDALMISSMESEIDKIFPFAFLENTWIEWRLDVAFKLEALGELCEPKKRFVGGHTDFCSISR